MPIHPTETTSFFKKALAAVAVGAAATAVGVVAAPVIAGAALGAAGFTASGVAAGSAAAAVQSAVYGGSVAAGSVFALCQSAGATGVISATTAAGIGGVAGASGVAATLGAIRLSVGVISASCRTYGQYFHVACRAAHNALQTAVAHYEHKQRSTNGISVSETRRRSLQHIICCASKLTKMLPVLPFRPGNTTQHNKNGFCTVTVQGQFKDTQRTGRKLKLCSRNNLA